MEKLLSAFELYFCKREKDLLFIFFEPRDRFFDDIAYLLEENDSRFCIALSLSLSLPLFFFIYVCVCVVDMIQGHTAWY